MGPTAGFNDLINDIDVLVLHKVSNGKIYNTVLTREDLRETETLEVDGYISGIMAFCNENMTISVEGQSMNKVRKNPDGTFSLKYYGKIKPEDLMPAVANNAYYGKNSSGKAERLEDAFVNAWGYSLFPMIVGDSVSSKNHFVISFERGGRSFSMPVRQEGFCELDPICAHGPFTETVSLRYIGNRMDQLSQLSPDLDSRLHAIGDGIAAVEATFKSQLIGQVNILDYEGIYNAVISEEKAGIWIYIETLRQEPIGELKTIAAHESLHKYVKARQLTRDSGVRELFADLKGYDALSYERFHLMMNGSARSLQPNDALFFAFINERNFLEDKKGGHSHENLDEFCTSFLHSLMFIDRLEENLDRPVKLTGGRASHYLSSQEKDKILETYVKGIEVMIRALSKQERVEDLLVKSLHEAKEVQLRMAAKPTHVATVRLIEQ
jgi:hypothetical protein